MKRKIFSVLLTLVLVLSLSLMTAAPVSAADGSGTCTVSPTSVTAGSTGNELTFTFTAAETMDGGEITIEAPAGWSAPQGTGGTAGYTTATSTGTIGTPTFALQVVTIPITNLANTQTITVVYGDSGGASGATAQTAAGTATFVTKSKLSGGTLTEIAASPEVTVDPDALDALVMVAEPTETVAGVAIGPVTVRADDQYLNTIESVTIDVTEVGAYTFDAGTLSQATDASGIATFDDLVIETADVDYQLHFASGAVTVDSALFDVVAAAFAEYTVVPAATTQTAGSSFEVTITAVDQFQNLSPSGIDDTTLNSYTFTFTGPGDAPDSTAPTYPTTADFTTGAWADNVTLVKAEGIELTVTDNQTSTMSGISDTITVEPADAVILTVTDITDPILKAATSDVIVTALDTYENTDTGYTGTVTFTSTDIAATLPADSTLVSGTKTFAGGVAFQTVGQQSVTAADTTTSSINGTQSGIGVYDLLITLNPDAWTLISTDDYLITSGTAASAWEGTVTLKYKYTGTSYESADFADLEPVEALYVKMTGSGEAGLNYSTAGSPGASIKSLVAGWNLVSSATGDEADIVLSPLRYVQIGEQEGTGLATLVSQGSYNLTSGDWYVDATDWTNLTEVAIGESMDPFDGYWVYMNAAKSFGVIP